MPYLQTFTPTPLDPQAYVVPARHIIELVETRLALAYYAGLCAEDPSAEQYASAAARYYDALLTCVDCR